MKKKLLKGFSKKKGRKLNNIYILLLVGGVMLLMIFTLNARIKDLENIMAKNKEREVLIQKQLTYEKEREEFLRKKREYYQSRDYIEDVAKERLGLIDPDEIILKPNE